MRLASGLGRQLHRHLCDTLYWAGLWGAPDLYYPIPSNRTTNRARSEDRRGVWAQSSPERRLSPAPEIRWRSRQRHRRSRSRGSKRKGDHRRHETEPPANSSRNEQLQPDPTSHPPGSAADSGGNEQWRPDPADSGGNGQSWPDPTPHPPGSAGPVENEPDPATPQTGDSAGPAPNADESAAGLEFVLPEPTTGGEAPVVAAAIDRGSPGSSRQRTGRLASALGRTLAAFTGGGDSRDEAEK